MDLRKLTDDVTVSPQITTDDVARIKAAGFRSIVCHRPDGESGDQTPFAEIARAAAAAGLEIRHQPVVSGQVSEADGVEFARLAAALPAPVLAYCRTGTRCAAIWSLAEAGKRPVEDILGRTRAAGYELSALAPRLEALAKR